MSVVGILGCGFVGKAVAWGFAGRDEAEGRAPKHRVLVYDKYKKSDPIERVLEESEIIFVCLPTPYREDELRIDLSIMDECMEEICPRLGGSGTVVVLKSTVVPGTTRRYAAERPDVHFAFNPEFLTEANYLDDFVQTERIVVGADNDWIAQRVIDLYRTILPRTPIVRMSPSAAEIVKYQSNITLAAKVALANVFFDICEAEGVRYEDVRDAVALDSRIGPSHLGVTTERGFGGKCFPKDLGAIIGRCRDLGVDAGLLEELNSYNLRIRSVRDWQEIAGAVVGGRRYDDDTQEQ